MTECAHLIEQSTCTDCRPRPAVRQVHGDPALYGPWFPASYDGECDGCPADILAGDKIRADGQGGWICEDCGEVSAGPPAYTPTGLENCQLWERDGIREYLRKDGRPFALAALAGLEQAWAAGAAPGPDPAPESGSQPGLGW